VLGLSITLAKGQLLGNVPGITKYAVFLGGQGMVSSAFGIATVFVRVFDGIILLAVEGLVTLLFIVGGITMAVMMKGSQCNDFTYASTNKIINCGGILGIINGEYWWFGLCTLDEYRGAEVPPAWEKRASQVLQQRCVKATANYGLIFALVLSSAVALGLGYVWRRKARKGYV
jgi:hypothetical protein